MPPARKKAVTTPGAVALLLLAVASCATLPTEVNPGGNTAGQGDIVVLLHGLARTSRSMKKIEKALVEAGYRVANIDYPSRKKTITELAEDLRKELEKCCLGGGGKIHFAAHSLGGILTRLYIKTSRPPNLGRVVMLAPPSGGSAIADSFGDNWLFKSILGPAFPELSTHPDSLPNSLGPADFSLGIIAGSSSWSPMSWLLPKADDGSVSVEAARLEGMDAFLVIPVSHTAIMKNPRAIEETLTFLRTGNFSTP